MRERGREVWRDGGREGGRGREISKELYYSPPVYHERVDLCDGDNLSHETAEPLRVQEEQLAQLPLNSGVEHHTRGGTGLPGRGGIDIVTVPAHF